jgi:hypothetical protein
MKMRDANDLAIVFGHQPLNIGVFASEPAPNKLNRSVNWLGLVEL